METAWGRPDGGATDEEGFYWSCGVDAGRVNRFSPQGELVAYVQMPVTHPTMPCFGGANGRTLYVTSLREGFTDTQIAATPQAGSVFAFDVDVPGAPAAFYKG
jgi:sugar lactone lactonase YvrE